RRVAPAYVVPSLSFLLRGAGRRGRRRHARYRERDLLRAFLRREREQVVRHLGWQVPLGEARTELRLAFLLAVRDHDAPGQRIALARDPHLQVGVVPGEEQMIGG